MDTILVVCGAGASSTFLASRLRAIAASGRVGFTTLAVSESELPARLNHATVVLVGAHLADRFEPLRALAAERGVAAVLLPDSAFGAAGAEQALALALPFLRLTEPVPPIAQGLHNA